ncbi:glycosyltransferase family 1 protein [Frigoribacterium sp. PhB24]|uniref:glycosyltransferase family 4 protein n=1 Tax=Frigoribacterium sp. PhB24 TaxID=2485204 RepID=UPI000F462A7B|nr:glycosyltransferase family 1 protein [Frigoribacterium sp. PhB24]ROS53033.1 glycosyltransferase involved in cell wall biosynthesis [Frigoribacterium sp. PhB24]
MVPTRAPVLLDATSLPPNKGGVARYIAGLLRGLTDQGTSIDVVVKASDLPWLSAQAPHHHYVAAPRLVDVRPLRLLWEQIGLPLVARRRRVQVIHSPHYTFSVLAAGRSLVTVHDATFFSSPHEHSLLKRTFFTTWIRLGRRLAAGTVAPSRATASEIARFSGSASGPVTIALHGVDPTVFAPPTDEATAAFARDHGLDPELGWIAFLGTVEPRKSIPALIEAHQRLRADSPDVPPLLIAGGLGWDAEARGQLEAAGDVAGAPLRHLGYLPLDHLSAFLGGSTLVVYPSTGEGFGLPVLEAMSCRATVLTTRRLALPEVGGDAVGYCEPEVDSIADVLGRLLDDPDERAALALAAERRAREFTWGHCAETHLSAYADVSGVSRR